MAKINCLSPYFITKSEVNLDSVLLELYIYTGTQTTSRPVTPNYSLETDSVNDAVAFEISSLVKDFFDMNIGTAPSSKVVWVDYQTTRTVSGTPASPDTLVACVGFYGYGYFLEGANPQNDDAVLTSIKEIVKIPTRPVEIPVDSSKVTSVTFSKNGLPVYTEAVSSSTLSSAYIKYITTGTLGDDGYKDRVIADGGTYEYSSCLDAFLRCVSLFDVDTIHIQSASGTDVIKVSEGTVEKWEPIPVVFVNKYGAYQEITFFGSNVISKNVKKTDYNYNIISAGSYDTTKHTVRTLNSESDETIKLASGFYTESFNKAFEELLDSEFVWLVMDSKYVPVTLANKSLEFKTQLNDKLISYDISFKYAYNKINNIR